MTSSDQSQVQRVVRGGSWSTYQRDLRSSNRDADAAAARRDDTGFRVAMVEAPEAGPASFADQGQDAWGRYADLQIGTSSLRFRWIAPGSFHMGNDHCDGWSCRNETPGHMVTFGRGFWIAEHETTRALYHEVMGEDPSHFADGGPDCPVESVSWYEAQEFCRRVNQRARGVRVGLPTEAQREYAGRAGTLTEFCTGSVITPQQANYNRLVGHTVPVRTYPPNAWGLYNVHGNVWEWTADEYHDSFEGAPADGSAWIDGPDAARARREMHESAGVLAQIQEERLPDGSIGYSVVLLVESKPKRRLTLRVFDAEQADRIAEAINEGAVRLLD